jgi:GNAT superfamily N-acetyltransferase
MLSRMTITNSKTQIRKADSEDTAVASAVLTAAFYDDPVTEWLVPDRRRRPAVLPPAFNLYFDAFQAHGETYLTEDGVGVALWLPPRRDLLQPEELDEFGRRMEEAAGPDTARFFELDEFFEAHAPSEPHWHLQLLGVMPDHQGQGLGSILLTEVLQRTDRDGDSAYLEATTLRNRALYERHGFECVGKIVLPDGPPLWQMWRSPQ